MVAEYDQFVFVGQMDRDLSLIASEQMHLAAGAGVSQ